MFVLKKKWLGVSLVCFGVLFFSLKNNAYFKKEKLIDQQSFTNLKTINLETIYGNFEINDPVIIELLSHPMMLRLKNIRQYGVNYYVIKPEKYHRYEHSVGVYLLLKKYGASLKEQVAGLLHDVSHTVFSHVGEWIFDHKDGLSSYQDDNHDSFLKATGFAEILEKHGFTLESINHKHNNFSLLEQDLPDLCLDRIEYNLQGGLRENLITKNDFDAILNSLKFKDDKWYFTDIENAKKFALISLYHTEKIWGSPLGLLTYKLTGQALKIAINKKYLSLDDIKFGEDDIIWQKLITIEDVQIKYLVNKLINHQNFYLPSSAEEADFFLHSKFRGVNPWVKINNKFQRLTEVDADYAEKYFALKKIYASPLGIKIII
jgi:HD superfamily phosphohydrolase